MNIVNTAPPTKTLMSRVRLLATMSVVSEIVLKTPERDPFVRSFAALGSMDCISQVMKAKAESPAVQVMIACQGELNFWKNRYENAIAMVNTPNHPLMRKPTPPKSADSRYVGVVRFFLDENMISIVTAKTARIMLGAPQLMFTILCLNEFMYHCIGGNSGSPCGKSRVLSADTMMYAAIFSRPIFWRQNACSGNGLGTVWERVYICGTFRRFVSSVVEPSR